MRQHSTTDLPVDPDVFETLAEDMGMADPQAVSDRLVELWLSLDNPNEVVHDAFR